MLNPYFRDGTRLRVGPLKEDAFSDEFILNDSEVEVVDVAAGGFARVRTVDETIFADGWCRSRNLTNVKRGLGLRGTREDRAAERLGSRKAPLQGLQRGATICNLNVDTSSPAEAAVQAFTSASQVDTLFHGANGSFALSNDEKEKRQMEAQQAVEQVRSQLRQRKRGTLDPNSTFLQRWDSVTTLAMLFTASVTPFEVCILDPTSLADMVSDPLSWTNRVVDCVFIFDICLQVGAPTALTSTHLATLQCRPLTHP